MTANAKPAKDKLLFTPGPLTTSATVKQAMLNDYGSRDLKFINIVKEIREQLLSLAGLKQEEGYEAVLMQGSGTFGVESVISCAVPGNGKLLIIINGAYGERIARMAKIHRIDTTTLVFDEDQWPSAELAEAELKKAEYTHIALIHSETTSGIMNPLEPFGKLAKAYNCAFIVDAMSSFGAVPVDFKNCNIDFLVSSSNKCIEGVPGFSFILSKKDSLLKCEGQSRTLSLDLYAQWKGLENNGQFRFTPPTHVLAAFHQALAELKEEGGVTARAKRYRNNFEILSAGMKALGFKEYLPFEKQGYIISTYFYPENPAFNFKVFYEKLNNRDFIIYPGKLTKASCFRVGNIGHLFAEDIKALLAAVTEVKQEMAF